MLREATSDKFFIAGFECSTLRRNETTRLDLIASTQHDRFALEDYCLVKSCGFHAVRDGIRWHLVERGPGRYDWQSFLPMLRAAAHARIDVIWDLCHYGWPDDIDIWSGEFVERFARFCAAAARLIVDESGSGGSYCLINEISFLAWAGGEVGFMNPWAVNRGAELKRQLVAACIAAIDSVREIDSRARFVFAEPCINVASGSPLESDQVAAKAYNAAQYEAIEMMCGRMNPELGGRPENVQRVGLNFYPNNQWRHGGSVIPFGHHDYKPFRQMIAEAFERYRCDLFISETGAEGSARASWLHYVCGEAAAAIEAGIPLSGLCWYPILNYPGWANDRNCAAGFFGDADAQGRRSIDPVLMSELRRQKSVLRPQIWERRSAASGKSVYQ